MQFKYTIDDFKLAKFYLKRKKIEFDDLEDVDIIVLANLVWKTNEDDS